MKKENLENIEAVAFAFSVVAFFSVGYVVIRPEYFTLPMPYMILMALGFSVVFTIAVTLAAVVIRIGTILMARCQRAFRKHVRMIRMVVKYYGCH